MGVVKAYLELYHRDNIDGQAGAAVIGYDGFLIKEAPSTEKYIVNSVGMPCGCFTSTVSLSWKTE